MTADLFDEIRYLEQRIIDDPNPRVFAKLSELYRKANNHEEAILNARKGLEKNESHLACREALGVALFEAARFNEAAVELALLIEKLPTNRRIALLLAQSHAQSGNVREAIEGCKKILAIDPLNIGAKTLMEDIDLSIEPMKKRPGAFKSMAKPEKEEVAELSAEPEPQRGKEILEAPEEMDFKVKGIRAVLADETPRKSATSEIDPKMTSVEDLLEQVLSTISRTSKRPSIEPEPLINVKPESSPAPSSSKEKNRVDEAQFEPPEEIFEPQAPDEEPAYEPGPPDDEKFMRPRVPIQREKTRKIHPVVDTTVITASLSREGEMPKKKTNGPRKENERPQERNKTRPMEMPILDRNEKGEKKRARFSKVLQGFVGQIKKSEGDD